MKSISMDILQHLDHTDKNHKIYFDITDHINDYPYYLTDIPDVAALRSNYELSPLTGGPIRSPFGYEVGSGKYSINWMINSYASQVPFTFADYAECIDAAEKLQQYIDALKSRSGHTDQDRAYLLRAEEFNVQLQKIARKLILHHRVNIPETSILKRKKSERLAAALVSEGTLQKSLDKQPRTNGKRTGKFDFLSGRTGTKD